MTSKLIEEIEESSGQMGICTLGEVFEYAGMLASTASNVANRPRSDRQASVRARLIQVAACALAVLRNGDAAAGLDAEDGWSPCSHEEALRLCRAGTLVRAAHWSGTSVRMVEGALEFVAPSGASVAPAQADRICDELISGRFDGGRIGWLTPDAEIPF